MDFSRTEEHELLARSLARLLADGAAIEARHLHAFTAPYHDPALWQSLAELGIQGAFLSPEAGGYGGDPEDVTTIFEEIGRALCAEPLLGHLVSCRLLERLGLSAELEGAVEGTTRLALAVVEPDVACDLQQILSYAEPHGACHSLYGRKSAIYGAPGADRILVVAKLGEELALFLPEAPQMLSFAMVDGGGIADLDLKGGKARLLASDIADALEEALDLGRLALCAEAVGAADHLFGLTRDYLGQRRQFGQTLSSFQALQHRLVDMMVELEQMRSITISAAAHFDTSARARHVAMAKALVGRAARRIGEEAIQLHGGIGMTWEYPGSHYAKRLVMIDHQFGDHIDHFTRLSALGRKA